MGFGLSGGVNRFDDVRSLEITSTPNSRSDLYEKEKLKQQRWYGPDGKAVKDKDLFHPDPHHSHVFPHYHDWKGSERGKDYWFDENGNLHYGR